MVKKIKIIYVISGVNYSLGFLWLSRFLNKERYDIRFVFLNKTLPIIYDEIKNNGVKTSFIQIKSKLDYPYTLLQLAKIFLFEKPNIVHAHLFEAGLLSMFVAKFTFIKKRIYTRHHATYNSMYFPHMVKYDKLINSFTTHIVSISENVSKVLIETEKVNKQKLDSALWF